MSPPAPRPPAAIVVGLDSITGLQVARILAARGVAVAGLAEDRREASCYTRRAVSVRQASLAEAELLPALAAILDELGGSAALVPCSDAAVLALSRLRHRLPVTLGHGLGDAGLVETLIDKERFADFAAHAGLRAPRTEAVCDGAEARRAASSIGFPCVAKPAIKSPRWTTVAGAEALVLRGRRELDELIDRLIAFGERWLVQEWVPGGDDAMYSSHSLHDRASRPVASSVVRKLRQWPPGAGVTTLAVHVAAPEIETLGSRALERAGWSGLCELEWKRHAATGELFVIEANPARATLNLPLAEASGVELITGAYRDAAGLGAVAPRVAPRLGTRWIWWRADRASAAHYRRTGELSRTDYLRSLRGHPIEAEMSWSDPLPFLMAAMRGLRRRLSPGSPPTRVNPNRSTARD